MLRVTATTLLSIMDIGPNTVDMDVFINCDPALDESLVAAAASLMKQYTCFKDDVVKTRHVTHKKTSHVAEKPRIGSRELSKEHIARKDFLALINKLSPQNFDVIRQQFDHVFRTEFTHLYVDMLWDAMLRSPEYQMMYVEMMSAIDKLHSVFGDLHRIWDDYTTRRLYMPEGNDASYDDFCDRIKAKKRAIASVNAWIKLVEASLCDKVILHQLMSHLLLAGPNDVILEELIEMCKGAPSIFAPSRDVIKTWHDDAASLVPMVRFKLFDLWEYASKNESYRVEAV